LEVNMRKKHDNQPEGISRRSVLGGASAALASAALPGPNVKTVSSISDSFYDPWIEINPDHLRHNAGQIQHRVNARPILAVIKNNGYGLGLVNVARALEPVKTIFGFAVVKLHEAMLLRDSGVRKPILLMGSCDERNLRDAIARDIMPMVYTPIGRELDRIAVRRQRPIPVHICVDTGFGREGVRAADASALIRALARRKSIRIRGLMMAFTEDPELDRQELKLFLEMSDSLRAEGIEFGSRHAASSFALFQRPESFLDMVRPGMALYGVYSEKEFRTGGVMDLRPAVSLKARAVYVKQLRKGDKAGYSPAYTAADDTWVALAPVGHADGWPRVTVKGARVRINDKLYPVIAVSASHSIIEIGHFPAVRIGDVITFFDWQQGSRPEDVSAACGSSVYDHLMHLGALLPRRVV
jgi:alanine racemase